MDYSDDIARAIAPSVEEITDVKPTIEDAVRFLTSKMDSLTYALAYDPLYRQADKRKEAEARLERMAARHNEVIEQANTYAPPMFGWTCFHCGFRFFDEDKAREHFGETPTQRPICQA